VKVPEETSFYEEIGKDLALANEIVLIGHGTGKSNAAEFLMNCLNTHYSEVGRRARGTENADLSPLIESEIEAIAKKYKVGIV
jgi:hypothetical protein